jgi:hypothetical protein
MAVAALALAVLLLWQSSPMAELTQFEIALPDDVNIARDGRFLFPVLITNTRAPFTVVVNWQAMLTR